MVREYQTFKETRQQKNISLEQVAFDLKIPQEVIKSLEENSTQEASDDLYKQALLDLYSNYLSDAETVMLEPKSGSSKNILKWQNSKPQILSITLIFVTLLAIVSVFTDNSENQESLNNPQIEMHYYSSQEEVVEEESLQEESKVVEEPELPEVEYIETAALGNQVLYDVIKKTEESFTVTLQAEPDYSTWISIAYDGFYEEYMISNLERKEFEILKDIKEVNVVIGNAPGARIYLNDEQLVLPEENLGIVTQNVIFSIINEEEGIGNESAE